MKSETYGKYLGILVVGGKPLYVRERDWKRIRSRATVDANGCWVVSYSSCCPLGHCQTFVAGKQVLVHRVAWVATYGFIPDGKILRHKCDNPRCINPAHLEPGTHKQNTNDMMERGRDNFGGRKNKGL